MCMHVHASQHTYVYVHTYIHAHTHSKLSACTTLISVFWYCFLTQGLLLMLLMFWTLRMCENLFNWTCSCAVFHIIGTVYFIIGSMLCCWRYFVSTPTNAWWFYCAGMFVSCICVIYNSCLWFHFKFISCHYVWYTIHVCNFTSNSFHVHYVHVFLTFNNIEYWVDNVTFGVYQWFTSMYTQ